MTYRLSLAINSGLCVEIETSSFEDLASEYMGFGGDIDWLKNSVKAAVAASEHGVPVATVVREIGGEVISTTEITPESQSPLNQPDPFSESAQMQKQADAPTPPPADDPFSAEIPAKPTEAPAANGTQTAPHSDPWASEAEAEKDWPGEAAVARTALTSNKPPPVDPWGAPSASKPAQVTPSNVKTKRDDYGREWTTGLPEAPMCNCDPPKPAAHVRGKSQDGTKTYTKWRCAKSSSSDWRSKCDLDEYINK